MSVNDLINISTEWILSTLKFDERCGMDEVTEVILQSRKPFVVAMNMIDAFVQLNWTGPGVSSLNLDEYLVTLLSSSPALKLLTVDTVPAYELCEAPGLVYLSHRVLYSDSLKGFDYEWQLAVAKISLLKVWQYVLDSAAMTLREQFLEELPIIEANISNFSESKRVLLYAQLCETCFMFYLHREATDYLSKAIEESKILMNFAGELGVNTKFQKDPLSQLFVKILITKEFESTYSNDTIRSEFPKNRALDDDTLLPETKFMNPTATENPDLCLEQQVVVCLKLYNHLKHMARDTSTEYECKALINSIVNFKSKFYPIQNYALFQRSGIDGKHIRYLDRLLMQMEDLQNCYSLSSQEDHKSVAFFALPWPSRWQTERQYADILFELGCTATALEIYLKLEMWEIAASCYLRLDRRTEGTDLITKRLEVQPTANLWCLLGDLKSDPSCYHKALELTNNKFSKAYSSLGVFYCGAKQMDLAIENFEKSLELNGLQPAVWYSLGCCAMTTQKWEVALRSFQRFVKLEPTNAEAWSNLGAVFINVKDMEKAHRAFSEAAKLSFDNWQIWENFLITSVTLKQVNDAIRCIRRLLELKDRKLDILALQMTTKLFIESKEKMDKSSWPRQKVLFLEFMGFVTSKVSTKYEVWECYGDVCFQSAASIADQEKGIRFYVKALRQMTNMPKVDTDFELFMKCVKKSEKLLKCFESYNSSVGNDFPEDLKGEISGSLKNLTNFYAVESMFFEHVTPETESIVSELKKMADDIDRKLKL